VQIVFDVLRWQTQILDAHAISRGGLNHLKCSQISLALGIGCEPVADILEGAAGQQAVAGGVELRASGHLTDFEGRYGQHLLRRIIVIALYR
jgi:hypothetical protein